MPLYEYLCESCGRTFEVVQSFSAAPFTRCDRCGGTLKKLLSAPAFHFKVSGWYVNDYGRSSGQARSADEAAKKDSSAPKDDASKNTASKDGTSKDGASKDRVSTVRKSKDRASKGDGGTPSSGKDS